MVDDDPAKLLRFRTGRCISDDDGHLSGDYIFIMEKADFDVTTIVGKRIIGCSALSET